MGGNTSIGRSNALPGDPLEFQYGLLKKRLQVVTEKMENTFPELIGDKDGCVNMIRSLIAKAMKIEHGLRPQLEKVCFNTVNNLFVVPDGVLNLECKLVDGVDCDSNMRIMPEADESYSFEDVQDGILMDEEVAKRRFIDALIMGGSYWMFAVSENYWSSQINEMSDELVGLYEAITVLDNYLLFVDDQKISDDDPKLNAYVSVRLGHGNARTEIKSEGILFPYLLKETVRGLLELFSSHGLPEDNERAMEIIRRADFIVAEPWDMRLGVPLWERFWDVFKYGTKPIPYYFAEVSKMPVDEFNAYMKEIMLGSKKGKREMADIIHNVIRNRDYGKFMKRMQQKNVERSVIEDGDFSAEELDEFDLK